MKNDFKYKINCLKFSISKRFELSISDVGRGEGSFVDILIWDANKKSWVEDFGEACFSVERLSEILEKAVRHCNNILMDEMIEDGDDRFITLD